MLIPIGEHPVDNELMGTSTTPRTLAVIDIENLCGGSEHVDRWQQYVHYLYEQYTSGISMPIIATEATLLRVREPVVDMEKRSTPRPIRN